MNAASRCRFLGFGALLLLAVLALSEAGAQTSAKAHADGKPEAKSSHTHICVEARFGNDHGAYLKCLNQQMAVEAQHQSQRQALQQSTVDDGPPTSPTALGLYNQTATRQRLGRNFGHSARPPSPPPPSYHNPLLHQ